MRKTAWPLQLLVLLAISCGGSGSGGDRTEWVGTWSTSPMSLQAARLFGLPATELVDQSVRMIVHTSIGGEAVRVKLTNQYGEALLQIGAATVGIRATGAGVVAGTERTVTFEDETSVTIPGGSTATSDAIDLALPPHSDLAITLYLPQPTAPSTTHPQAATGYLASGDATQNIDGSSFRTTTSTWFFLDAVDVLSPTARGAIVAFGDSVTEGTGTTFNANRRWPDFLSRRLAAEGIELGILNQGINGNKVLNSLLGESALRRFDKDVLGQSGVEYVILLEGINDIGLGNPDVTAERIIEGYRELIARAHEAGLPIFGGTLTPAKDNPYAFYVPYEESKRVTVNQFIRESGEFDGVIDFDAAVSDPAVPEHWRAGFSPDALHPSDVGAEALANAVDLSLFR